MSLRNDPAIINELGLKVFQQPTGDDLQTL
jgi:hypothetical protein